MTRSQGKVKPWPDSLGALEHKLHLRAIPAGASRLASSTLSVFGCGLPPGCVCGHNHLDGSLP